MNELGSALNPLKLYIETAAWKECDDDGVEWWCAQQVKHGYYLGPVFKSRVSRMRAESYLLADHARELAEMG